LPVFEKGMSSEDESWALFMLGKISTTELRPSSCYYWTLDKAPHCSVPTNLQHLMKCMCQSQMRLGNI
jgi:hypothetical protein